MRTDFTVVVVAYRSRAALSEMFATLDASTPLIVVNNSMDEDDLADLVDARPGTTMVDSGGNVGFSEAANIGARNATSDIVIFMNPDTLPTAETLVAMADIIRDDPTVVACGAAGIDTSGGGALPSIGRVIAHVTGFYRLAPQTGMYFRPGPSEQLDVGWISGSCCAVRRDVFLEIDGYDPDYFVFMSDFDLGRRLGDRGYRQVLSGSLVVPHIDGQSSDIPSTWTWGQRGKGWAQYLQRNESRTKATVMKWLLVAGFTVRGLVYRVTGKQLRASEQTTMISGIRSEWSG